MKKETSFTTQALNVPFPKKDAYNALQMPVYESVAYEFDNAEQIAANFRGEYPAHVYSRTGNPTVEYFEHKLKSLTGGHAVLAMSSGMAAISNAFLTLCQSGDNVIAGKNLFGHTYAFLHHNLAAMGMEARLVDFNNIDAIEAQIDNNTRVLFFETVTNPQLEIADIEALAKLAKKHHLVLMADTTITPPLVFDAQKWGVDIEVMSTTKFISGGATAVGGAVVDYGTYRWESNPHLAPFVKKMGKDTFLNRMKKHVFRQMGGCMTAHSAYFQILGLDILELRLNKCVENCQVVGRFLEQHPKVKSVNYPALKSSTMYAMSAKYFDHQPGAIMTFELKSEAACFAFMNQLKIIRRATNLNDNKTLIIHPYSTIYTEFSDVEKKAMAISPLMMRLSVGIEGAPDIMADIEQAL